MSLKQALLTEKRSKNVIIVDIQPIYKQAIRFDMWEFTEWLKEQRNILYYHNGPETTGGDTSREIINWLMEQTDYDEDLYSKLTKNTLFYDKGYAFFRNWMDNGVSERVIKQSLRFMMENKVNDSRDIPEETWIEKFPELKDIYFEDNIYLPDIPLNVLRRYSGGYLVGGGKNECLKEIEILMSTFNMKTTKVKRYIYG